jgi:DUF4097 and DUF4098 domain-containing protein YvlB
MSNRGAIGFGGFLLGLGLGYILFRGLNLTFNSFAWVLIILGAAIVLSAIVRSISPRLGIHRIVGGLAGGLIFALFLTQGISFFTGIVGVGNGFLPYSTTDVKTYTGASTTGTVYLKLGSMNGEITFSTWDKQEYSIVSTITARGSTQSEADSNLANLAKDLAKVENTTRQSLTLIYNSPILINNPYQINVDVKLPASAKLDLNLATSNGMVSVSNVNGGNVSVQTSNGALQLTNVKANTLRGTTSNGPITGILEVTTCDLSSSNGPLTIQIPSSTSGNYTLRTSNGNADITLGSTAEYRLDASTSNAAVTFSIPNFTYSRDTNTSKAGQTVGYDSAQTRISVNIETSNGSVTVSRDISGV